MRTPRRLATLAFAAPAGLTLAACSSTVHAAGPPPRPPRKRRRPSPPRLFCHVCGPGRRRDADQRIPGWPYQLVVALESGPTSWTAVLDAVRLGPADDPTAVTAAQLHGSTTSGYRQPLRHPAVRLSTGSKSWVGMTLAAKVRGCSAAGPSREAHRGKPVL